MLNKLLASLMTMTIITVIICDRKNILTKGRVCEACKNIGNNFFNNHRPNNESKD